MLNSIDLQYTMGAGRELSKAMRLSKIYITIENETIAMAIRFAMATVS